MFRLDFIPERMFGGVYIQPESSKYYSDKMFTDVDQMLSKCRENGYTPFIGGDFNSRLGDLNKLTPNTWKYEDNCDRITNKHGRTLMSDICKKNKVYPINHLKHKGVVFHGDHTYIKNEKKSQIDYAITNSKGRGEVVTFKVIDTNWHISDHRPIALKINFSSKIRSDVILARAHDLNYEDAKEAIDIKRFNKQYDSNIINDYMVENKDIIEKDIINAIEENDIDLALDNFNDHIMKMHHSSKVKYKKNVDTSERTNLMNDANAKFQNYLTIIQEGTIIETNEALDLYLLARQKVTRCMMSCELEEWNNLISKNEDNKLWKKISWKGEMNEGSSRIHPPVNQLKEHFENIYSSEDDGLKEKLTHLSSNIYIPILDDPITDMEVNASVKKCKKGGYDFPLITMKNFVSSFMPVILLLLNVIFYCYYPIKLACSLLFSIPKKGNLRLPKNFRGIQMLPTLGVIYDRILYARLEKWMNIHDEQTGFQKGKSTLHQIFTIRLLIALAKSMKITLYIGCFDIEKAFDKVSRFILLQKLITYGISYHMLNALKSIYSNTSCILNMKGKYSSEFPTESGIRQGASSSSLLFILFINDLIDYIRNKCDPEPLIESLHCLLHADDTLIISTSRTLFTKKCNLMNDYFKDNQLKLNIGKSGYLVINGKKEDEKCQLELNKGQLKYKSEITYLGVIISDSGNLRQDIISLVAEKRSNVTIKFNNFCGKNFLAPLNVKLKVLQSCVVSSLLYSCETWSQFTPTNIEVAYRIGIKTALNIRYSCCNEVLYIESGLYPLECEIKKRQLQFWQTLISDTNKLVYIQNLLQKGLNANIPFVRYYQNLELKYMVPEKCVQDLRKEMQYSWKDKIVNAFNNDANSRLGAYLLVNPSLITPDFSKQYLLEHERAIITKMRTGTHYLAIEKGRFTNPRIPRENRKCICDTEIQTLQHVILNCPLLQHLRVDNLNSVSDYVNSKHFLNFMLRAARILKVDL